MMKTRMLVGAAVLAAFVCGPRAEAEVRILSVSGLVRVAPQGSESWSAVVTGQALAEGMVVVTGDDGRVTISVGPGNTVRLRGNAKLAIRTVEARKTRFQLIAGKLKGAFTGLSGRQRFELEFAGGSAIASVKGTVFTAENGTQTATINTIYGEISVNVSGDDYSVMQGCGISMQLTSGGVVGYGVRIEVRVLDETALSEGLNREGSEGGTKGDRSELYVFVNNSGSENSKDREIVNQIREDDFTAGRTLKDVHGNIARVDQRLYRPDSSTVEFVNIVKRDSYDYRTRKFTYNGYSGPRYDFMQATITMNTALPNSVLDWPAFFSANHGNVQPTRVTFSIANGGPNDSARDEIRKVLDLDSNGRPIVVRRETTVTQISPFESRSETTNTYDETFTVNGKSYLVDTKAPKQQTSGKDSDTLAGTEVFSAYPDANGNKLLDDNEKIAADRLELRVEGYAIDSNGEILKMGSAMEAGMGDPLGYIQSIAAEAIVSPVDNSGRFVFGQGGTGSAAGNQALGPSNIDMVVIPDIAISVFNTYLPTIAMGGGLTSE